MSASKRIRSIIEMTALTMKLFKTGIRIARNASHISDANRIFALQQHDDGKLWNHVLLT